jgi:hypothetical protein
VKAASQGNHFMARLEKCLVILAERFNPLFNPAVAEHLQEAHTAGGNTTNLGCVPSDLSPLHVSKNCL